MSATKIEWCETTWNPVTGCTPVSEGCEHCYARRMANRLRGRFGYPQDDPFKVTLHPDKLDEPLHWRKPRVVFVCSMGDLFHKDVLCDWQDLVWDSVLCAKKHTFIILTKRPREMQVFMKRNHVWECPPPNVWLGVTVEHPKYLWRITELLKCPAAVHFVSFEPLLGAIRIPQSAFRNGLDWVVCGGETGPGARPMHPDWARKVRDDCQAAGVPFFFKHWGEWIGVGQLGERWRIVDHPRVRRLDWREQFGPLYPREEFTYCVGRKAAGRLLDGRLWEQRPEIGNRQ